MTFATSPYGRGAMRPAIPDVRISASELPAALVHCRMAASTIAWIAVRSTEIPARRSRHDEGAPVPGQALARAPASA
jgi:hypothetical protein